MASWSTALAPHSSTLLRSSSSSSSSLLCVSSFRLPLHFLGRRSVFAVAGRFRGVKQERSTFGSGQATPPSRPVSHICKAAEYKFPDPIPEFAAAETEKFRNHMLKRLSKRKDIFGDSVEDTVAVCAEIFETFLHAEYGGPGTLLVMPFIDMADTVNERGLPGGPQAAHAAVKWAQDNVDKDWKEWTGTG